MAISNVMVTDGYTVSFLCQRIKKRASSNDHSKKPPDFAEDINVGCTVWAVDPGVTDIITAVNSSDTERLRTASLDEYFHLCGFNDANIARRQHQSKNETVFNTINNFSTLKTTLVDDFVKASKERVINYQAIYDYYSADSCQICSACKYRSLENVTTAATKRRVHAVLQLPKKSMIFMFAAVNDNQRPAVFKRD
ncbi:hypothetical protein BDF20DRAFT_873399 [Mycotypha africana]|uniref:uncharacterized protein n=1 Tax=Mycotypha africana TaxID=64632 RepID=UPI0023014A52|nr:uncharacterized protein BDF20DRAFT_873399 [Mycotypha africana]KAI8977177.1 hypothetical protein BDF20DRAFT_873399 [Mycotypha africana]